jgi:hypothetical protein
MVNWFGFFRSNGNPSDKSDYLSWVENHVPFIEQLFCDYPTQLNELPLPPLSLNPCNWALFINDKSNPDFDGNYVIKRISTEGPDNWEISDLFSEGNRQMAWKILFALSDYPSYKKIFFNDVLERTGKNLSFLIDDEI